MIANKEKHVNHILNVNLLARGSNRCKKLGPLKDARSLGGLNLPHALLLEAFGAGLSNNSFERGQNLPGYSIFFTRD